MRRKDSVTVATSSRESDAPPSFGMEVASRVRFGGCAFRASPSDQAPLPVIELMPPGGIGVDAIVDDVLDTASDQRHGLTMRHIVDPDGHIIITKRRKPLAKLIRLDADAASLIRSLRGKLKIKGNIS